MSKVSNIRTLSLGQQASGIASCEPLVSQRKSQEVSNTTRRKRSLPALMWLSHAESQHYVCLRVLPGTLEPRTNEQSRAHKVQNLQPLTLPSASAHSTSFYLCTHMWDRVSCWNTSLLGLQVLRESLELRVCVISLHQVPKHQVLSGPVEMDAKGWSHHHDLNLAVTCVLALASNKDASALQNVKKDQNSMLKRTEEKYPLPWARGFLKKLHPSIA